MAADYFLEIDGIKGETQDHKHKETIEIDSFSWGANNMGTFAGGGGGGAGKVSYSDLSFTTSANKASPKLMLSCATGAHIKKATLFVRKAGGKQEDYYTITMSDVLVSSYQSSGSAGGDSLPMDSFSLNFAKIEYAYKPQKADGTLDAEVKVGYDLKKNEKV